MNSLSAREITVIKLIALGKINKEIADELGLALLTFETHRERIYRKINCHGTADVVHYALKLGLVNNKFQSTDYQI